MKKKFLYMTLPIVILGIIAFGYKYYYCDMVTDYLQVTYYLRISLQWYRCSGRMVPRGADAWYHLYRSDGTGTKPPLHTLSKGALQDCATGHPELA